jgi:sialidase-1
MGIIYKNPQSYCGPINMVRKLANGDLVLVFREAIWRDYRTHFDPTTRTSMVRSSDGGETWHTQVTPHTYAGNGCVVCQISDGSLIVSNFRWIFVSLSRKEELEGLAGYREVDNLGLATALDGVHLATSRDNGYTWEPARKLETPGHDNVSNAGRIVETADRTLLIPLNGAMPGASTSGSWVMRSSDGGKTWEEWGSVAESGSEASFGEMRILVLPSGRLLAGLRTETTNFQVSHSDDGGRSWSPPVETPIFCNGSSPFDLVLLRDGRVLATYGHRRPPFGVRACLSGDEGETWDVANEKVIRDDGLDRDMGYPSSEQLDDGSILTVYYWHEEDQIRYLASSHWQLDQ